MDSLSKIPTGMRYCFGEEACVRRRVEDAVMKVFERRGYEEIVTPTVDYYALFERGMGADEAERAFRFADADGRQLALRPDVTSSVARAAATLFAERPRPLRFCYAAPVFRRRPRSHVEWRRESKQLGCELIGASGLEADAETLSIVAEILSALDLRAACRVTLNDVEIFNGVAEALKLNEDARERMRRLLDARDSAGLENHLRSFNPQAIEEGLSLINLARRTGKFESLEESAQRLSNSRSKAALENLKSLWRAAERLNVSELCEVDFGDVSGLDYYTGLVFKIYLKGAGAPVGSGGRYDNLAANFGCSEPSIGFVLDLDPLVEAMKFLRA